MTSGGGRSAGTVIPSVGSGRYAPGPNIALPSLLRCWTGTIRQMSLGGHPKPGIYTTVSVQAGILPRKNRSAYVTTSGKDVLAGFGSGGTRPAASPHGKLFAV